VNLLFDGLVFNLYYLFELGLVGEVLSMVGFVKWEVGVVWGVSVEDRGSRMGGALTF
jgi:hypothetical protein